MSEGGLEGAVTVVIPAKNRVTKIDRAIQSVYRQTYPVVDIIVVDDASEDGTADFVEENYPDIRVVRLTKSVGAAQARNIGTLYTATPFIAFLDSDDSFFPDKIRIQVDALERTGAGVSTSGFVNKQGRTYMTDPIGHEEMFDRLTVNNCLGGCSGILARTEVIRRHQFDVKMTAVQDWELYLRLCREVEIDHIPEPLYYYSTGETNRISNNATNRLLGHRRLYDVHLHSLPGPFATNKRIFRLLLKYLSSSSRGHRVRAAFLFMLYSVAVRLKTL